MTPGLALLEAAKWTLMLILLHFKRRTLPGQLCALHLICASSAFPWFQTQSTWLGLRRESKGEMLGPELLSLLLPQERAHLL